MARHYPKVHKHGLHILVGQWIENSSSKQTHCFAYSTVITSPSTVLSGRSTKAVPNKNSLACKLYRQLPTLKRQCTCHLLVNGGVNRFAGHPMKLDLEILVPLVRTQMAWHNEILIGFVLVSPNGLVQGVHRK